MNSQIRSFLMGAGLLTALLLAVWGLQATEATHSGQSYVAANSAALAMQVPTVDPSTTAEPAPALQPYVNITRAEYESALALWNSQQIKRYNIVANINALSLLRGSWQLVVRATNGTEQIERFGRAESSESVPPGTTAENVRDLTVSGLFERVRSILDDAPAGTPVPGTLSMYYKISFDPTLGYPTVIEGHPNEFPGQSIADADSVTSVTSLTILTDLPGMPSTGNPGR
ncbi:MAG: hypothetical protein ABI670_03525 [Chloroflexota bacterium]